MTVHVPYQRPGVRPPRIAFVAEAPSDDEVAGLRPLIGPSGRIFNAMLRAAGLDRSEFLVTNVFDEKLPDNEVGNWCLPLTEARAAGITADLPPLGPSGFLRPDHRWHLDRLRAELEEWQPTVIVPLGGTALWALTGQTSITAHRGAVIAATRLVPGVKMVPTLHPAFVMRQWKFFPVVVGDFVKANAQSLIGPAIQHPKRSLFLEPTLDDLADWTERLVSCDLLSVDIETGWGQITNIGFAPSPEYALNVPFVDLRVPSRSYWSTPDAERQAWRWTEHVLGSPVPKLGQNFGAYDGFWFLEKRHIAVRNLRHDDYVLHHVLYPELPKGLEFMGNSYATQGVWKSWGKGEKKDD